ncbi:MAG TPA: hypothetical protein VMT30_05605 [Candidatus Saccharimonadia bacterium]|nr:hypothetical protein [Candidatus Saccharimonadia bacterium]
MDTNTTTSTTDEAIRAHLRECKHITEEVVRYALTEGGSVDLLANRLLMNWFVYRQGADDNPRVEKTHLYAQLAREVRGDDFARGLVRRLCCTESYADRYHRITFWMDPAAQDLFGSENNVAYEMAIALARLDPGDVISHHRETLAAWFARVSMGAMGPGWVDLVLREAASHLRYIDDAAQLEAALALPWDKLLAVAARCEPNGWNLILMGYALARGGNPQLVGAIERSISQQLESYPHQAPLVWRWVAEGFRREAEKSLEEYPDTDLTVDALWRLRMYRSASGPSSVHRFVTALGWQIVTLGKGLQATVTVPGQRPIVFRHVATAEGDEVLHEGDEVLVSVKALTEGRTPTVTPAGRMYPVVLMPATPPTAEMLAERLYFYVGPRYRRWWPGMGPPTRERAK